MSIGVHHHQGAASDRYRGIFLATFGVSIVLNVLLGAQIFWRSTLDGSVFDFNRPLFGVAVLIIVAVVVGRWAFLRRHASETIKQIGAAQAEGRAVELSAKRDRTRHTSVS